MKKAIFSKISAIICFCLLSYLFSSLGSIGIAEAAADTVYDFEDGTTMGWVKGWGEGFEGDNPVGVSGDLAAAGNNFSLRINSSYAGEGWEEAVLTVDTAESLGSYESVSYDIIIPSAFGGVFVTQSALNNQLWADLKTSEHNVATAQKTTINGTQYVVVQETASIPEGASQKQLVIKLAKNSAVTYTGPVYVDNIRLKARTETTPPEDSVGVVKVTAQDAVLEGYGVQKRGSVPEGSDTLYDGEGYISFYYAEEPDATEPNGTATFHVNVAEAGLYKLSVGYYIPSGYGGKETGIQVNGAGAGAVVLDAPAAGTVREEKMASKVMLNAGANTVTFSRGWGYYGIEYIEVELDNPPAASSKLEAEDGIMTGSVSIGTSGSRYSGNGYAAFKQDGSLTLTYTAASAGMYDIDVGYSSPNGEKKTTLALNGQTSEIAFADTTAFVEVSGGRAMLDAGNNTIVFTPNWGWYNIDYVKLTAAAVPKAHDVGGTLVNPNATPATKKLMDYLVDRYGQNIISGQQEMEEAEWIYEKTSKYPAILGSDLMDYSPSRTERGATSTEVEKMIGWFKRGGIVALAWHWNAPKDLIDVPGKEWWRGFYTDATNFDVEYAMNNPESEEYRLLLRDIDVIAAQLKRLEDAGVPVLWRPLHEAEGGWFWWGAKGAGPVKALYRLMYDRLTNHHGLDNLIWVWNSEKPEWYPGDDVVDIVTIDYYGPNGDYNPLIAKYDSLVSLADDKKIVALAENGSIPDPDLLKSYRADWSYFTTWGGKFLRDGLQNASDHIDKVYNSEYVITLDELPNDLYGTDTGSTNPGSTAPITGDTRDSAHVEVDGTMLSEALDKLNGQPAESQVYEIEVGGDGSMAEVTISAVALAQAAASTPNAVIVIKSKMASYMLPVTLVDVDSVAARLGVKVDNVRISVKMEQLEGTQANEIRAKAETSGFKLIVGLYDFSIIAESDKGSIEINDFGSTYVTRTISLERQTDGSMTAVVVDPDTGEMSFVPAVFDTKDGKTVVTIKRNGNSIYTVAEINKTFNDLEGHWARTDIERLTNKLVIDGIDDSRFAPHQSVTRAEFAAMLARALGLAPNTAEAGRYTDVQAEDWFAGAVGGAVQAGLVRGYSDGTFRPDAFITREQLAVMVNRAAAFAGQTTSPSSEVFTRLSDSRLIGSWAKDAVSGALDMGLMQGLPNGRFAPSETSDRAQAATVINRLLEKLNFI
ncbi:glycosyl hydrolase [Paenibacillus sp. LPE1-1-1.1]|uniref:glycosyl hydrolase n=1 Tax=Paenibacillus sp. LPE1-1-1.1 TaxID=3135230 RepID=UPI00343D70F6